MKKLIFTAIALIAFSSVSMANTISDENEVVKANNIAEIENLKVFKTSPLECLAGKLTVYNQAIGYGMSSDEASTYAYRYYFRCMGEVF